MPFVVIEKQTKDYPLLINVGCLFHVILTLPKLSINIGLYIRLSSTTVK